MHELLYIPVLTDFLVVSQFEILYLIKAFFTVTLFPLSEYDGIAQRKQNQQKNRFKPEHNLKLQTETLPTFCYKMPVIIVNLLFL